MTAAGEWDVHWDEYAASAELNPAQAYRRRLILDLLECGPHDRIVDIGSGQGDLARDLMAAVPGAEVVGLEVSRTGVEIAAAKVPGATFVQRDLLAPATGTTGFEGWATRAVCSEVLEHVDHPDVLLRHALDYLAPGCRVVVTVPGGPRSAFDRHIGHRRHYAAPELRRLLESAGLVVDDVRAAGFPFFNLYKLVVMARGRQLIRDIAGDGERSAGGAARVAMKAFDKVFPLNLSRTRLGWQLVAVAHTPPGAAPTS